MERIAWIVFTLVVFGPLCVHAEQVSCFSGSSCSGAVLDAITGFDENMCCAFGSSYQATLGLCCSCSQDLEVMFSQDVYIVSEGAEVVAMVIQRCGSFEREVQLSLTFTDVTAEGGVDYGPFPSNQSTFFVTISPNVSQIDFGINIREDSIVENAESFSVGLGILDEGVDPFDGGSLNTMIPERTTTVVIEDNDFVVISVDPSRFTTVESANESVREFLVHKEGTAVRDVSVIVTSVSVTATGGSDFIEVREELVFSPEENVLSFNFMVLDDSVVEGEEVVELVLLPGEGETGVVFQERAVDVIIQDDNDMVQVFLDEALLSVTESTGQVMLTVSKQGLNERDVSVQVIVAMSAGALVATATDGADFNLTMSERMLTFAANDLTKQFTIEVIADGVYENEEVFFLILEPGLGETAVEVTGEVSRITIQDSDVVVIGFSEVEITISEAAGLINVTLQILSGLLATPIEVEVFVSRATGDLAEESMDFNLPRSTLSFSAHGSLVSPYSVLLVDDLIFEGREEFTLGIRTSMPRVELSPAVIVVSIVDSDRLEIQFQNATYVVSESDSHVDISVMLLSTIERDITLDLVTSDGSAQAGSDYESVSQTLTFTPTSSVGQVRVNILEDDESEGLEEFSVAVVLVDEMLGTPGLVREVVVRILDDESVIVELARSELFATEGENLVLVLVTKSGMTEENVDVVLSLNDGSAKGGIDYGFFPSTSLDLTIPILASEVQVKFGVVIFDDNIIERREDFSVSLSLPGESMSRSNIVLGVVTTAVVYIADNDVVDVTLEAGSLDAVERDQILMYEVKRLDSHVIQLGLVLTLTVSTLSGSATAPQDFVDNSMAIELYEGSPSAFPFNVSLLDDDLAETLELFSVILVADALSRDHVSFTNQESTFQIIDNDVVRVNFLALVYQVRERSEEVSICLTKDTETALPFSVVVQPFETSTTLPDTSPAIANLDFSPLSLTATFQPGDTEVCVTISITRDTQIGENREVFAVNVSVSDTAGLMVSAGPRSGAIVVIDDVPDVIFGFTRTLTTVAEIGTEEVCIEIFNPAMEDSLNSTLSISVEPILASAGATDFQLLSTSLTLNDSTRRSCFQVEITNDDEFESLNESFNISISSFSLSNTALVGLASVSSSMFVIVDDDREVVVGFNANSTRVLVDEGDGKVVLCVSIYSPGPEKNFSSLVEVSVGTRQGSAGSDDYVAISSLDQDLILTVNATATCFEVIITDDIRFEGLQPEVFEVLLTPLYRAVTDLQRITADPAVAIISIQDNDGMIFVGFERDVVRVEEDVGKLDVCVELLMDNGSRLESGFGVRVFVLSASSSAEYQIDFDLDSELVLSFNDTQRRKCFEVTIIDDQVVEGDDPEDVVLQLQLLAGSVFGISVAENRSTLVVLLRDNDQFPVLVNDTVLGDPLFIVPLSFDSRDFQALPLTMAARETIPHLCFEIHGNAESYFNLVSDSCTSVNALYTTVMSPTLSRVNIISKVGITAVASTGSCVFIEVGAGNNCRPIVRSQDLNGDGQLDAVETVMYNLNEIVVSRTGTDVRVSVPNCGSIPLVMYLSCEHSEFHDALMLRIDVRRGINLLPTSHGLIGQFWNVPISIQPYSYNGPTPTNLDRDNLYAISVSHPASNPRRFVVEYYTRKWDLTRETCFYAGNVQGGSLLEIVDDPSFNDPVIEGDYLDYSTGGLFQNNYTFSRFSGCMRA